MRISDAHDRPHRHGYDARHHGCEEIRAGRHLVDVEGDLLDDVRGHSVVVERNDDRAGHRLGHGTTSLGPSRE